MAFNVQKSLFDTQIFKNLPTVVPTPFPRSVVLLPRFGPVAICQWSYCLCLQFMFTFPVILVKETHIFHEYVFSSDFFLLEIFQKNPPKVCTRSFNFNPQNAKAPSCRRGDTPLPHPPPARALRAPRLLSPSIVDNLPPPPWKKFLRTALSVFSIGVSIIRPCDWIVFL